MVIISFRVPPTFFTPPSPEPLALGSVGGNKFLMLRAIAVMPRIKKGQMGSRGAPKQTPAKQFYSLAAQLPVKTME